MSYQTKVDSAVALAVPGQAATPDQSIYTALTYLVAEPTAAVDAVTHLKDPEGAKAGTFVWRIGGASAGAIQYATNRAQFVEGTSGGDTVYDPVLPLGIVERVVDVPNYAVLKGYSDEVPPMQGATIAVKGDYYVKLAAETGASAGGSAVTAAKAGDAVYVGVNGEVIAAAPGTEVTQTYTGADNSSYTSPRLAETSWRFVTDTELGGIALISNWRD